MSKSKKILIITVVIVLVMFALGFINYVLESKRFEENPSNINYEDTNVLDESIIENDNDVGINSKANDIDVNKDDNIIENITDNNANNNTDNSSDIDQVENANQDIWVKVSIYDAKPEDLTETVLVEPMTYGLVDYPLVASIPEEDIYLFGADDGVILRHGDLIKTFEWNYLTPRFVLPRLKLEDIDDDGVEEIICILYVASGTGLAIEELHILEPDEDEIYRDIFFTPEDYDRQIHELITFDYDEENNKLYYIVGELDYEFDAPEVFTKFTYSGSIGFGIIKMFDFNDGITVEDNICYGFDDIPSDVFINTIAKARVIYLDESFTITDLIITPPPEEPF